MSRKNYVSENDTDKLAAQFSFHFFSLLVNRLVFIPVHSYILPVTPDYLFAS